MTETQEVSARKYEPAWQSIKDLGVIEIRLNVAHLLTEQQVAYQLKTIRRAVQKEKWMDYAFKRKYPNALLESIPDVKKGSILFKLTLDTLDVRHLF